jgi:hypothetical protein
MRKLFLSKLTAGKMFLVSILLGVTLGIFDATSFLSKTAIANNPAPGCEDGAQCKAIGCAASAGSYYCSYRNIYGTGTCPQNIECIHLGE